VFFVHTNKGQANLPENINKKRRAGLLGTSPDYRLLFILGPDIRGLPGILQRDWLPDIFHLVFRAPDLDSGVAAREILCIVLCG
jgi:hypothetical protein